MKRFNPYASLLQACINLKGLKQGKAAHAQMIKTRIELQLFLENNLVNFYCKCEGLPYARNVFDKMSERNVISWNAIIAGYVQHEHGEEALALFRRMHWAGLKANEFTFGSILRACASLACIKLGNQVHAHTLKTGFQSDIFVGSAIVDMYVKSGSLDYALQVFYKMPERNAVSWTAMITGYAMEGFGKEALQMFQKMQQDGINPTYMTFASLLSSCAGFADVEQGKQVHCHVIKFGFESDVSVGNALLTMYAKCDSIEKANQVFDEMSIRDGVTWNSIIAGYAHNGHGIEALVLFCHLQWAGMKCNQFTFGSVLKACSSVGALMEGKQAHAHAIKTGFELNVFVGSTLVDMYAKCGRMKDARVVFDKLPKRNVVSWNATIVGYAQHGLGGEVFRLFQQMQCEGIKANPVTFASVLSACIGPESLKQGQRIHVWIVKSSFLLDVLVMNALVTMYSKCGSIEDARQFFDEMPDRDLVSWNAMIAGYAQIGHGEEAMKLFCKMKITGVKSDQFTFTSVLRACASLTDLAQGKQVHIQIIKTGFESDVSVANALVTMYAKCGVIEAAISVFDIMSYRDTVSYNAMIAGYAQHGCSLEALHLFEQMQCACIKPDQITFVGVLSACSHGGLVDEGRYYFASMSLDYGIMPSAEHHACMVDLLGRAGLLDEAEIFMNEMPFGPNALVCRTLLGACRVHGNLKLGRCAAECLFELEPQDAATYVTLSNIYSAAGQWDNATEVRNIMKGRGVKKEPGFSWIEVKNRVHVFVGGE